MGIWSRLLGSSGDEPEPEPEPVEELTRYFFIGQLMDDPIDDATIILQERRESADDPSWNIVRSNEPLRVPDDRDSSICVYRRGSIIARNEAAFQAHYAWLLSASEREALDDESRSEIVDQFPFPERLRGHDIPAASSIEREQLEQLYLSISLDV